MAGDSRPADREVLGYLFDRVSAVGKKLDNSPAIWITECRERIGGMWVGRARWVLWPGLQHGCYCNQKVTD